jgi:hypothetical protein
MRRINTYFLIVCFVLVLSAPVAAKHEQPVGIRKIKVEKICNGEAFSFIEQHANSESEVLINVFLGNDVDFGKKKFAEKKLIVNEVVVPFWNYKYRIQSPRGCLQPNKCSVCA